ncbi:hypothetical protein C241_23195 [Bradyrhizobium lupini HPC(L)]|uniref:Uncharacterized protein n=1 Tax=Bradyrhizobium lupini HPC(L) TaxID=1229491 RepID=A0ABP2RKY3_RHILU|nr:hypothetical protein C241_23195 [Bradyrhizobium lupini HPC(L)]
MTRAKDSSSDRRLFARRFAAHLLDIGATGLRLEAALDGALVGLVALRTGGGGAAASRISSFRRSRASSRLRSWLRNRLASIISTPSFDTRLPPSRNALTFTLSGREGEFAMSKNS